MPNQRVQVPKLVPKAGPQAAGRIGRDTFQPVSAQQQAAAQLAGALSEIAPALSRFASGIDDPAKRQRDKEEHQKGGIEFMREAEKSGKDIGALVRKGAILPQDNPHWIAAMQREAGAIMASREIGDFLAQGGEWLSLSEYDSARADHRAQWEKANLPEASTKFFRAGFDAAVQANSRQERLNVSRQVGARLQQQDSQQLGQIVFERGKADLFNGVPIEESARALTEYLDARLLANPAPGAGHRQNSTVAQALISLSRRMGDASYLEILDFIETGPPGAKRPKLSSIPVIADAIEDARQDIETDNETQRRIKEAVRQQEKEDATNAIYGDVFDALEGSDSPNRVDLKGFISRLRKLGANAEVNMLYGLRDAYSNRQYQDDPLLKAQYWGAIYGSTREDDDWVSKADVRKALANQSITPNTHNLMVKALDARDERGGQPVISDPWMRLSQAALHRLFENEIGAFESTEQSDRFNRAQEAMVVQLGEYLLGHPDADANVKETMTFIGDITEENFFRYGEFSRIKTNEQLPARSGGPTPVDWTKEILVDKQWIRGMKAELKLMADGEQPDGLSDDMVRILRIAGMPDANDLVSAQDSVWAKLSERSELRALTDSILGEEK